MPLAVERAGMVSAEDSVTFQRPIAIVLGREIDEMKLRVESLAREEALVRGDQMGQPPVIAGDGEAIPDVSLCRWASQSAPLGGTAENAARRNRTVGTRGVSEWKRANGPEQMGFIETPGR